MHPQRLADLTADGQHRIQARHRLLEDHRNVVAADGAHLALGESQEILCLEADRASDLARGLGDEPHERHGGDRLAAAGFTDDGQRLAFVDVEGDAVDGAVDTFGGTEMGLQILDFEQCHRIRTSFLELVHSREINIFDGEPDRIRLKMLYRPLAMRGSIASRRPSPSRLTASTVADRNAAEKNTMWGFTCHSALPSAMMLPQDGMVGGVPAPMKERMDSTIMALAQI